MALQGGRPGGLFSGDPRILLALVLELDSHRGEICDYFCEK